MQDLLRIAVLHLRFAEEWGPEMTTRALGRVGEMQWVCDACGHQTAEHGQRCCPRPAKNRQQPLSAAAASQRMSQVIVRAKRQALEFLASIGVRAFTEAETWEASPTSR